MPRSLRPRSVWASLVWAVAALLAPASHAQSPDPRGTVSVATAYEALLRADDPSGHDNFGYAVAVSGDRVLVGDPTVDDNTADVGDGVAYVFAYDGTDWHQEAKLVGPAGENFGWAVALDGDRAAVGAPDADGERGAVYVYVREGTAWRQEARLTADINNYAHLGYAVSLSGDQLLVGVPEYRNGERTGAAFVFERSGSSWNERAQLLAIGGQDGDAFGWSVALDGDRAAVGAILADVGGVEAGAAYVFERQGGAWSQAAKLEAGGASGTEFFGWSVDVEGDRVVVGATWAADRRGEAYLFEEAGPSWSRVATFSASGSGELGRSVAIEGGRVLVGEYEGSSGASARLYTEADGWSSPRTFTEGERLDFFGFAVDLHGDRAVVGAPVFNFGPALPGAAYVLDIRSPPATVADEAATDEDVPVVVDVLANDVYAGLLVVASVTDGRSGTVVVTAENAVEYTPAPDFYGTDTFVYYAAPAGGGAPVGGTVAVTVAPVNDPPTAVSDVATVRANDSVVIDVLANDTDVDGDPLTVASVTAGAFGSVAVGSDGRVTYTPDADVAGEDAFEYTASDGSGGTATATVAVTVTGGVATSGRPNEMTFAVGPARPNPSLGPVTVPLTVPVSGAVRVRVLDAVGREVTVIHDGPLAAGTHEFMWAPETPGIYVVVAEAGAETARAFVSAVR